MMIPYRLCFSLALVILLSANIPPSSCSDSPAPSPSSGADFSHVESPQVAPSSHPAMPTSPSSEPSIHIPSPHSDSSPPAPPPPEDQDHDQAPASSPTPSTAPVTSSDVRAGDEETEGGELSSSGGMKSGEKAGIVVGVIMGAGVVGFAGFVYKKRQHNIRRTQYSSAARRELL